MSDYETPWVDDHDPLCPPYLGAREGRAECAICEALEKARAEERERAAVATVRRLDPGGRYSLDWDDRYEVGWARITREALTLLINELNKQSPSLQD